MSAGGGAADADEKTRGLLRAALARGRAGAAPRLMREHCLAPERRPGGIVVQRLMLAPEAHEGDEHAVPVVLVHSEARGDGARPLICFMHGTGGDSEGLLETHLVPFAKRGYCALGVDAPCHGRRLDPAPERAPTRETNARAAKRSSPPSPSSSRTPDDADGLAASLRAPSGHVSLSRSRSETFERYGAALVAAWRGGSEPPERSAAQRSAARRSAASETIRRSGHSGSARPFLFDGAWDCLRAVRFATGLSIDGRTTVGDPEGPDAALPTRAASGDEPPLDLVDVNVDETRVGVSGVSLGGMYAWLAAAAAPETIAAAAPLIGAQDFGWALRNERWRARVDSLPPALFRTAERDERETLGDERSSTPRELTPELVERVYDAICPGLTTFLDGPRTFPLVAPRPMLIVNGELDPRNPLEGVRGLVAATRRAYESKKKTKNFVAVAQRGVAHACTPQMLALADAWLDWRLRPAAAFCDGNRAEAAVAEALRDAETWLEL
jgi:hypothetical protein